MDELSGTTLGQYHLLNVIGRGGMSTVFRAHQPSMDRDVAIKIISPDLASEPEFIARFEREAQIVAGLSHPHIVPVYDFGRENHLTYLVMRQVEGGSLAQELDDKPLPAERVTQVTRQIASALDYAHQHGIVHRDLKPTNVLLDKDGNIYLTDFGIAKLLSADPSTGLTMAGAVMGTPTYMAPEQWRSEPVDGRTDIYALGVILYQMLLGRAPFIAETPHSMMYQHLDMQPPAPHLLQPDLPLSIEPVINKALAKRREDRYPSAHDLAADLEVALQGVHYEPQPPRRLPEQTLFEAERVAEVTQVSDEQDADLYAPLYEDELLALADESERQNFAAAPTSDDLPPVYNNAPPPYQPPVREPGYYPPPGGYRRPPNPPLNRGLLMGAIAAFGILFIVIVVVISATLLSGDDDNDDSASPTPPVATVTATPEFRPAVSIQSPAEGTTVDLGNTVTVQFLVTDREGVTRVELRRFNIILDSATVDNQLAFQGSFNYRLDSTGAHRLEIVPWRGDVRGDPAAVTIYAQ